MNTSIAVVRTMTGGRVGIRSAAGCAGIATDCAEPFK
jgi:hypothetical protein